MSKKSTNNQLKSLLLKNAIQKIKLGSSKKYPKSNIKKRAS